MLSSRHTVRGVFTLLAYADEKQRSESLNKVKNIGTICQAAHAFFCQCGVRLTTTVINLIKNWPQQQSFEKGVLHRTT